MRVRIRSLCPVLILSLSALTGCQSAPECDSSAAAFYIRGTALDCNRAPLP